MPRAVTVLPCLLCFLIPALRAEEVDDFVPGLLARYTAGETSVERIVESVHYVDLDLQIPGDRYQFVPDVRLKERPQSAHWEAQLLIRQNAEYRLHVHVAGHVEILIDGKMVLNATHTPDADTPHDQRFRWFSSEPIPLEFGDHSFVCRYRPDSESPMGRLALFWSSDLFPLEPIPRESFFREETHRDWQLYSTGRRQFIAWRCQSCHSTPGNLPSLAAPSLERRKEGLSHRTIVERLTPGRPVDPGSRMPHFDFTDDEALSIAAYLFSAAKPVTLDGVPKSKDFEKDVAEGKILVHSRGCLACHKVGDFGNDDLFAGPSLDGIASRASPTWIYEWLRDPAKLNPTHRMPVVELSDDERRQITRYLQTLGTPPVDRPLDANPERAARGKQLIEQARCANCHAIPGVETNREGIPALSEWRETPNACFGSKAVPSRTRPLYLHPELLDPQVIGRFLPELKRITNYMAPSEKGELLLETKNCIQCHERGGSKGIAPVAGKVSQALAELNGQSETMVPPSLRQVGDKLLEAALTDAVQGKQPRRMNWLRIRMPRYTHSDEDVHLLADSLSLHDAIPDDAPDPRTRPVEIDETLDPETLLLSNTLVGPKGFSCVACHQVGSFVPRNVAPATRGSDLLHIGKRMRSEYFVRWTRSPIRIVPGMEMPSIGHKPVPGILEGDIEQQLAAIWKGLNHPGFTIPTDPASVEQFLSVLPNEPLRIVRDVFTLPKAAGEGYVPRALAVGFPNAHSVLFDLDRFELRQWTYGDFARQRTQGKSWYWDMAGQPILSLHEGASGFVLVRDGQAQPPVFENAQAGRLASYRRDGAALHLEYALDFDVDGRTETIRVGETWQSELGSPGGWSRRFEPRELPPGCALMLVAPSASGDAPHEVHYEPAVEASEIGGRKLIPLNTGSKVLYLSSLSSPQLPVKPQPIAINEATSITSVPGFDGVRMPLDGAIMPTAFAWDQRGRLLFTSLKGHLFRAVDSDSDGLLDRLELIEEGLAAPYGVIADGDDLIVAHKPELLRLIDNDGDGTIEERRVFSSGWGYSDDYHDWTCGLVRDERGNLYVGLGSNYSQPKRPEERSRWRGSILRIASDGTPEPIAFAFRYPTGLAFDRQGRLFATDNQGVQNTFNELNHIVEGKHYGVPARFGPAGDEPAQLPAIQIPYPWSRSINGIAFVPDGIPALAPFAGHGIGAEYDSRFLIRFTLQEVDGVMQGATYHFSRPVEQAVPENFVGPIAVGISPQGEIYIGSIHDSGWLGGQNTGAVERLTIAASIPNGIRELTATRDGFRLEFFHPVDPAIAVRPETYLISGYTRKWGGAYATEDSERHRGDVTAVRLSEDRQSVELTVAGRREGFVYEVTVQGTPPDFWPATSHYTLHRVPK